MVRLPLAAALAVAFASVVGCGTSAYEDRVEQAMDNAGSSAAFAGLFEQATEVAGTGASVRLPGEVGGGTALSPGQQGVDLKRLHPPFAQIPGLKTTYEVPSADLGANAHWYLYVAGLPAGQADAKETIRSALAAQFTGVDISWQPFACATQSGGSNAWEKLSINAPQEFYRGESDILNTEGVYEVIHYRCANGAQVIVAWRIPQGAVAEVNLANRQRGVGGSLTEAAAAPAG